MLGEVGFLAIFMGSMRFMVQGLDIRDDGVQSGFCAFVSPHLDRVDAGVAERGRETNGRRQVPSRRR